MHVGNRSKAGAEAPRMKKVYPVDIFGYLVKGIDVVLYPRHRVFIDQIRDFDRVLRPLSLHWRRRIVR